MERKVIAVLFILVSLMAASCSKIDALFNNGEPITETREMSDRFLAISMYNNVNVKLVHDSHPRLELTCPENLIEKVITEINDDTLYIKNENEYNWLRSYDYSIDLTVYYDSLRQIDYASVGNLHGFDSIKGMYEMNFEATMSIDTTETSIDTIWSIDTTWVRNFYLNIDEGCGDIDLTFNCDVLKSTFNNGTSCVTLRGIVNYTVTNMRSYGVVHAENLHTNIARVKSESTNDAYVWVETWLIANLHSIGNVYYKGNPSIFDTVSTSNGHVIPWRP